MLMGKKEELEKLVKRYNSVVTKKAEKDEQEQGIKKS